MGGGVRPPEHRRGAGRPVAGVGEKRDGQGVLRHALDSANRYAILYQIGDAKWPETQAQRIEKYVAMLGEKRKPYA